MKIQAEVFDKKDEFITLRTSSFINQIEIGNRYNITFKKYHTNRSLEQNAKMWALIQAIARETQNDEFEIYTNGLEKADCSSEFLMVLPEALESVKKSFRAVKICESRKYNNKDMLVVKVFIGSSKYDSEEMSRLIKYFEQLAAEVGVEEKLL